MNEGPHQFRRFLRGFDLRSEGAHGVQGVGKAQCTNVRSKQHQSTGVTDTGKMQIGAGMDTLQRIGPETVHLYAKPHHT